MDVPQINSLMLPYDFFDGKRVRMTAFSGMTTFEPSVRPLKPLCFARADPQKTATSVFGSSADSCK